MFVSCYMFVSINKSHIKTKTNNTFHHFLQFLKWIFTRKSEVQIFFPNVFQLAMLCIVSFMVFYLTFNDNTSVEFLRPVVFCCLWFFSLFSIH